MTGTVPSDLLVLFNPQTTFGVGSVIIPFLQTRK